MICEYCGKDHEGAYGSGRFCSQKCARSFSSVQNRPERNAKISQTLRDKYAKIPSKTKTTKSCKLCGKKLRYNNKTGYCIECLRHSNKLKNYRSNLMKNVSSHVQNHTYWMPRNQTSYAELFWIRVLNNNDIEYVHDYVVQVDKHRRYFLDFYIQKNTTQIDLEIDGKQHLYADRQESDKKRDEFLQDHNYIVYRIPWNEINTDQGKELMRQKIEHFLAFYNSI